MKDKRTTNEVLCELMSERGIDSKRLAEAIGVSESTICRWRSSAKFMRLSNAIRIVEFFGCSLDYLVGRSEHLLDFLPQKCPPFYDMLRKIMHEKSVSRYNLNLNSKIKSSHLVDWKKGSDPHILSLVELADFFDVTLDQLVGREG